MSGLVGFYAPVLSLAALLALALTVYGWRRRHVVPGGAAFAVFNVGVAIWTCVSIPQLHATGATALFWANMAYFGIVLLPGSWLVFALRHSGRGQRVTRLILALLCIEPLATLLLAWTNPWHLWFRKGVEVTPTWEPGPAFWLHAAYSYALVFAGTFLMARGVVAGPRLRRGQGVALLIAAFAPWIANGIYLSGLSPFGNLDPSPFGFGLTSLVVAWVLFRELELRLLAAERRFRALVDQSLDVIEVIDPETGRYLDVNERGCVAHGYTREEYLALTVSDVDTQMAARPWTEVLDEVRRAGSQVYASWHRRKDGSSFPVEVNATYASLERNYVLRVVRDVTEKRRLEEQFRQAQKMEAVGRVAGGVAHDFNNILGIIIGYGDIVSKRLGEENPMTAKVKEILKAADRAASLTRQLLAFSRQQVLQPKILDVNRVVADMEDMIRRLIGEDVVLTTTPRALLGNVEADQGQLQQVLMNLALNARDAMPGGGRLTIATGDVDVDEADRTRYPLLKPGPYVMLGVTDTGAGMNASVLPHVFEPFFTTKGLGKGTGLGLSTVYGIVQQSGGHIDVESEAGVGTSFRIYLPRVAGQPILSAGGGPASLAGGSETVLLVEDEANLRDLLSLTLEGAGYRVLMARDGLEALEVAGRHTGPIHVLVTDVIMPGLSGRKAADTIREARPEIKVLYISGYTDDAVLRRGVSGCDAFLAKPFPPDSLLREVRGLLISEPRIGVRG